MNLPTMRTPIVTAALLTLALLGASAGHAADKPKSSFGGGKAGGAVLTREQLRACLAQQAGVTQRDEAMPKEKAALGATHAEISRGGVSLKERLDALDRTDEAAVAAYNDEAQARDKQIDDYQARVTSFNARVEALKVERDAFVTGCGNRSFFEEDEIALRKGR